MSRLNPRDRILVASLFLVWLFAFTFSLLALQHPSSSPVFLDHPENGDAAPRIRAYADWSEPDRYPLRVGDRILAVDGHDMRGRGPIVYRLYRSAAAARDAGVVGMTIEREGDTRDVVVDTTFEPFYAPLLITSLVHALVAILVLLRAPAVKPVRPIFVGLMFNALQFAWYFAGSFAVTMFGLVVGVIASVAANPLMIRAFLRFPPGARSLSGWNRVWPWLFPV